MKQKLYLILVVIFSLNLSAQDECASAVSIQIGSSADDFPFGFNITTSTDSGLEYLNCGFPADYGDLWFKTVVPASGRLIVELSENTYQFEIYSGSCGALILQKCAQYPLMDVSSLTPGETIYVRVWRAYNWGEDTCNISIFDPAYNVCSATNLAVGTSFNEYSIYGNDVATPVSSPYAIPFPNCTNYRGANDIWFTTTIPASGRLIIELDTDDFYLAVYTGDCNNNLNLLACNSGIFYIGKSRLELLNLTPNQQLYIKVFKNGGFDEDEADFTIAAYDVAYNLCSANPDVQSLTVGAAFNDYAVDVDLNGVVASNIIPSPECGDFALQDKWFSVTVPASGRFIVETNATGFYETSLAAYTGDCNNNLQLLNCSDYNIFNDWEDSRLEFTDLTSGEIIYIRTWEESNSESENMYQISAYDPEYTICANVVENLTVGATFDDNDITVSLDNLQPGNSNVYPTPLCGYFENEEIWYSVTVPNSGNVTIKMDIANSSDIEFAFAVYSGNCNSNLSLLECASNYSNITYTYTDTIELSFTALPPNSNLYIRIWGWYYGDFTDFQVAAFDANLANTTFQSSALKIYPNPSTGVFTISTNEITNVKVYDLVGKLVREKTLAVGENTIDISSYAAGMYIVKATNTSDNEAIYKIVKQ